MKRWAFVENPKGVWDLATTQTGAWVLFEDHEKAEAEQRALIEQQRQEIERLTHELIQANEACAALRDGKPLGPVIGAQTIVNQAKRIAELEAHCVDCPNYFKEEL